MRRLFLKWENGDAGGEVELSPGAGQVIGFDENGVPALLDFPTPPLGFPSVETDPEAPNAGDTWFNTADGVFRGFDGNDVVAFTVA